MEVEMGLLDALISSGQLGNVASLVAKNPQILGAAASLLSAKPGTVGGAGGLGGLIGALTKGGHGDVASSWVGKGANLPIDPSALAGVLGNDTLSQFAQHAGIDASQASSMLAGVLPGLINHLTPQGQVPETNALEGILGSLLGGK
jgi:uncharacterized protein YidB (DUF937 family)